MLLIRSVTLQPTRPPTILMKSPSSVFPGKHQDSSLATLSLITH